MPPRIPKMRLLEKLTGLAAGEIRIIYSQTLFDKTSTSMANGCTSMDAGVNWHKLQCKQVR